MESQFPYLLLIALVFLFFIIIPSMRRNSKEKKFLNNLKRGDRIITKSGVHARITEFDSKSNTCLVLRSEAAILISKTIFGNTFRNNGF